MKQPRDALYLAAKELGVTQFGIRPKVRVDGPRLGGMFNCGGRGTLLLNNSGIGDVESARHWTLTLLHELGHVEQHGGRDRKPCRGRLANNEGEIDAWRRGFIMLRTIGGRVTAADRAWAADCLATYSVNHALDIVRDL